MRTITTETNVYTFDELPQKAQEKAIQYLWDANVDYEWWDAIYEDAERIGLKLTVFDLGIRRYAKGKWTESPERCAELILKEHGEDCETYSTARNYLFDREKLVKKYSDGNNIDQVTEDNEDEFDQECDELDADFLHSLCEDYSIILQKESEYLTSEEAIVETITANEYEFTIDGNLF